MKTHGIGRDGAGGYRFDKEDIAALQANAVSDEILSMAMAGDWEIPQSIDWIDILNLKNQGGEGSCQGQGLAGAGEGLHYRRTGKMVEFSADFAYYRSQAYDGIRGDQGSTLNGGRQVAEREGFLLETLMPYRDTYAPNSIPDGWKEAAAPYRISKYAILKTYRDIVEWQARNLGEVWWGIRWAPREGPQGEVRSGSIGRGGHAVQLAGWGGSRFPVRFTSDGLPEWLWTRNSWKLQAKEISLRGWSRWYRSAIESYLQDRYTVCVGISDMNQLKPSTCDWLEKRVI